MIKNTSKCQTKELLETSDIAEWFGVSVRTVANLRTRHLLPYIKLGHLVRFRRSRIESVLNAHTVEGICIRSKERRGEP